MAGAMFNNIQNHLKSLHFHYLDSWLKECIEYYQSNDPSITENQLKEEVRQQWLLINLRDIKVPVFPQNLQTQPKTILNGKYAVQVETLLDSGQPRYTQLLSVRNQESDNIKATVKPQEHEIPNRRCITMTITDGVSELTAMEYEKIPGIRLNDPDLPPGFKMLISGPVICRKGMLLLGPNNVTVLGGEVDVLVDKNKYESLLLYSLGLSESDRPKRAPPVLNRPIAASNNVPEMLDDDDDILMDLPLDVEPNPPRGVVPTTNQNVSVEEQFHDNIDDDMLCSVPEEYILPPQIPNPPPTDFRRPTTTPRAKVTQTSISQYLTPTPAKPKVTDEMMDIEVVEVPVIRSKIVPPDPFVYLSQISETTITEDTVFKVKAIILTLKTRISVQNDEFTLEAKISDGSQSLDVKFSSDVLENMLDLSPSEMTSMVKEKRRDPAIGERLKKAFAATQQKLISLDCIFYILFFASGSLPLVLRLDELSRQHLENMKARTV